jgi:hypothetical protein
MPRLLSLRETISSGFRRSGTNRIERYKKTNWAGFAVAFATIFSAGLFFAARNAASTLSAGVNGRTVPLAPSRRPSAIGGCCVCPKLDHQNAD